MSAEAQAQKTVAFVLYPGLTPLDLIGPLQVMSALPPQRAYSLAAIEVAPKPAVSPLEEEFGVLGTNPEWVAERERLVAVPRGPARQGPRHWGRDGRRHARGSGRLRLPHAS